MHVDNSKVILIIDDEESIRKLFKKIPWQIQEIKLRQALGQMDSSLPEGVSSILTGAILLALQAG